jgi:hypothetical protein
LAFAAATERFLFLGDELFAGGLGCGNDLVETLIIGQRIVARTEAEIAAQISPMSRFPFCDQFLKPRIVADCDT